MAHDEEQQDLNEVKGKAVSSLKWTFFSEVLPRIINPIVLLILARLLTPDAFGTVAIATIVISFASIFQTLGFEQALIQRETRIRDAAHIVFWTNLAASVLVYALVYVVSPFAADFFSQPSAVSVIRVLSLQIVLTALVTVHTSLFRREFQFKTLFFANSIMSLIPLIVTVPLAFFLHNVWALVWGALAGSIAQLITVWSMSPWRPKFSYDVRLAKTMMRFGIWVTLEAFFGWALVYGDNLIVARVLGVYTLGLYSVGWNFVTVIFTLVTNPLVPIAYSSFSRLQSQLSELKAVFLKTNRLLISVILPLGVGLALMAQPIASLVFGQKWVGVNVVIASIGLMFAVAWIVGVNAELYRALGRPDVNVKLLVVNVLYYIPVYLIAAPNGLPVFCVARLGVAIASLPLHFYVASRLLGVPFTYIKTLIKLPLVATVLMAIPLYAGIIMLSPFVGLLGWIKLGLIFILAAGSYILIMWFSDREYTIQAYQLVRNSITR